MQPTANFSTQRVLNAGARPQRLLWASTRTKNPSASDLLYVKALAAPFTVNTMPEKTLNALADHGESGGILSPEGGDSEIVLAEFASAGINIDDLTALLQDEGAKSFVKSWNDLICCIESKSKPSSKLAFVIQQLDFQEGSAVMTTQLSLPDLAMLVGTRAVLGAGIGLLVADRLSNTHRKTIGWTLVLIGAEITVPLAFDVLGHLQDFSTSQRSIA